MHFALVCRLGVGDVYESPENTGYNYAEFVKALERRQVAGDSYEVIDTTKWSDARRADVYIDGALAAVAAAGRRFRVARVFGSNRHPGEDFGWRVPALLIYADRGDRYPRDVYPREYKDGRLETIADFFAPE